MTLICDDLSVAVVDSVIIGIVDVVVVDVVVAVSSFCARHLVTEFPPTPD